MKQAHAFIKYLDSSFLSEAKELLAQPNGRHCSWDNCYGTFKQLREQMSEQNTQVQNLDDDTIDKLALHLDFYLASWGMYRGSSCLLQLDHTVHEPIVRIVLKRKYNEIAGMKYEHFLNHPEKLNLIMEAASEIRESYDNSFHLLQPEKPTKASDTLVTKVLLGTLACCPAYDRNVKLTLRKGLPSKICQTFKKESLENLLDVFREADISRLSEGAESLYSPPSDMRLIDLTLWLYAYKHGKEL